MFSTAAVRLNFFIQCVMRYITMFNSDSVKHYMNLTPIANDT